MANFVTTDRLQQFFTGLKTLFVSKSGDTLTGTLTTRTMQPSSNSSYNLGASNYKYQHIYGSYLHGALEYTTTAPTSANTSGYLKIAVLASEPSTKYDGWLYLISE